MRKKSTTPVFHHPVMLMVLLGLVLATATQAWGQREGGRWTVDQKSSLAWWQIVPHMEHLFGTTRPQDPAWIPGWGRDSNSPWHVDASVLKMPGAFDTLKMPLFPRGRIRAVCSPAVRGEFEVPDTVNWKGIRGSVNIDAKEIASGQGLRDKYMQGLILESATYPDIVFNLDSVANMVRTPKGDTLYGNGFGSLVMRSVSKPVSGRFKVWRDKDAPNGIRVVSRFHFPAGDLQTEYKMSKWALGLGVASGIWRDVWEGVDLVLVPATASASGAQ